MRPNAGSSLVASDTSLAAQRHYNDGNALQAEGRFDAAVVAYRKALIQAKPHLSEIIRNIGRGHELPL